MHQESPFHAFTRQLLEYTDRGELAAAGMLLSDDCTGVDLDAKGSPVTWRSREEWLVFSEKRFLDRQRLGTEWRTEIKGYSDVQTSELTYAAAQLYRRERGLDLTEASHGLATLVWKRSNPVRYEWKVLRWHITWLKKEVL